MKVLSIPRLELLSCLLLSNLITSVKNAIEYEVKVSKIFCWSDSQIAIWWIKQTSKLWKTWIENRVSLIRKNVDPENRFFVTTDCNPADIGTRKSNLNIIHNSLWWEGPDFLRNHEKFWPSQDFLSSFHATLEEKVNVVVLKVDSSSSIGIGHLIDIHRFSTLGRLMRVTSYILRFIHNLKAKANDVLTGELTLNEIKNSEHLWIKYDQSFIRNSDYFKKLKNSLNLFDDDLSILRSKTRTNLIDNFSFDRKYPIILDKNSYLTKLFILQAHEEVCHNFVNSTLTQLRSKFWIVHGRQTVKKVLKNCYICKYIQGKSLNPPKTPPLPKFRIQCDHTFENVGINYAGPLYCKDVFTKSEDMNKCYILLFTCAVTRVIHLEVTPDVGTHLLILALKRFISRRGIPKLFISDNFKTFKSVELKNMLRNHKIEWIFILEKSPWWGGFYERMIGIVKTSLKKVIGKASLT